MPVLLRLKTKKGSKPLRVDIGLVVESVPPTMTCSFWTEPIQGAEGIDFKFGQNVTFTFRDFWNDQIGTTMSRAAGVGDDAAAVG